MSSASRSGSCSGSTRTAVPMVIRLVRSATAIPKFTGDPRMPYLEKWCSASHTESNPRSSASSISSSVSRSTWWSDAPSLTGNRFMIPNFTLTP